MIAPIVSTTFTILCAAVFGLLYRQANSIAIHTHIAKGGAGGAGGAGGNSYGPNSAAGSGGGGGGGGASAIIQLHSPQKVKEYETISLIGLIFSIVASLMQIFEIIGYKF